MKTNKEILFPYYSGKIQLSKVIGHCSLDRFIQAHENPNPISKRLLTSIKKEEDPKVKRTLKHKLYSFTPSVMIKKWDKRKYTNVQYYTQLMQVDLDKIYSPKLAKELKYWLFLQPECITSYFSPSGDVKALIRIKECVDKNQYKAVHKTVQSKYEETGYFDTATNNAMLPLFLSLDSDILYRQFSEAVAWTEEDNSVVEYVSLNEVPKVQPPNFNENDKNKTIRILKNKISRITSNGHPQVRSAALILGSRVGAGYITLSSAESEISLLINQNQYLSKGTKGYLETAFWAIHQGIKNPKYY